MYNIYFHRKISSKIHNNSLPWQDIWDRICNDNSRLLWVISLTMFHKVKHSKVSLRHHFTHSKFDFFRMPWGLSWLIGSGMSLGKGIIEVAEKHKEILWKHSIKYLLQISFNSNWYKWDALYTHTQCVYHVKRSWLSNKLFIM